METKYMKLASTVLQKGKLKLYFPNILSHYLTDTKNCPTAERWDSTEKLLLLPKVQRKQKEQTSVHTGNTSSLQELKPHLNPFLAAGTLLKRDPATTAWGREQWQTTKTALATARYRKNLDYVV